MKEDKLSIQSMDFAVSIIELVKSLKEKRESNKKLNRTLRCSIFVF